MLVDIKQAREGMVLRAPVTDAVGRVLLPAGAALDAKHIEKLQRWGIHGVDVQGGEVEVEPAPDPQLLARIDERLAETFGDVSDPLMADLRALASEHLKRNADLGPLFNLE